MGEVEKRWASKVGLLGLFEVQWRRPQHDLLVEFLNSWKVEKKETIYVQIVEKVIVVDKHVIIDMFKISSTCWKEWKQADKQIVEAMLQGIILLKAYITIE